MDDAAFPGGTFEAFSEQGFQARLFLGLEHVVNLALGSVVDLHADLLRTPRQGPLVGLFPMPEVPAGDYLLADYR
jgi:hypothetical protein